MSSHFPVLIVGAGPSGLTAALALAKNNVPVRIVDKAAEFHHSSRGAGQHIRTVEIFQSLGVLEDLLRKGAPVRPLRGYKLPGGSEVERTWTLLPPTPQTPDRPYQLHGVSQYLTEGILREHLETHGIQVEKGIEPVAYKENAAGVVVDLKKTGRADDENVESFQAAYVIGADGAKGVTRKLIGAVFEGETKDADGAVWIESELEGDGVTEEWWHIWSQPDEFTITARPKAEGGFAIGIICKDFDPVDLTDPVKFVNFFHEKTGRHDVVFRNITSHMHWKPNMRMANKFSEGRVFIVGDAAHVHSPTGGQGLNTSVQDSYNLAWKIALAHRGLAAPSLLDTYGIERIPVVAQMLATTTNLYAHAVAKSAKHAPKEATDGSGLLRWRNRALTLLEVNYRFSPLSFDIRGDEGRSKDDMLAHAYEGYGPDGGVRAGDRAPEAPGLVDTKGNEMSLFRIFKPSEHTILMFTSGKEGQAETIAAVVKLAQTYPEGIVQTVVIAYACTPDVAASVSAYHDKDGHAAHAYGIESGAPLVVVVRPDGYVGAFVNDAEGVQEYFKGVLKL